MQPRPALVLADVRVGVRKDQHVAFVQDGGGQRAAGADPGRRPGLAAVRRPVEDDGLAAELAVARRCPGGLLGREGAEAVQRIREVGPELSEDSGTSSAADRLPLRARRRREGPGLRPGTSPRSGCNRLDKHGGGLPQIGLCRPTSGFGTRRPPRLFRVYYPRGDSVSAPLLLAAAEHVCQPLL